MVSDPKLTNIALLDPGDEDRCSHEYLDFQKACNKICLKRSLGIKRKDFPQSNGHLNVTEKKKKRNHSWRVLCLKTVMLELGESAYNSTLYSAREPSWAVQFTNYNIMLSNFMPGL